MSSPEFRRRQSEGRKRFWSTAANKWSLSKARSLEGLRKGGRVKNGHPWNWKNAEYRKLIPIEKCSSCGKKEPKLARDGKPRLEVHHINGNRGDNRVENLAVLCYRCHQNLTIKKKTERIGMEE